MCAIKSFYEITVGMPLKLKKIPFSKRDKKMPKILEEHEIQLMFDNCPNKKHRTIMSLLYACGLRIGEVINLKLEFSIVCDTGFNRNLVLQNVIARLRTYFNIKNFEIDQPIIYSDLQNIIYNNPGVVSVQSIRFRNLSGQVAERNYSEIQFDVESNIHKGILIGPPGSLFEVKYKNSDIVGVGI